MRVYIRYWVYLTWRSSVLQHFVCKSITAFCYIRIYIHTYIVHTYILTYIHIYVHTILYAQFTLNTKHNYSFHVQTPIFNSARSDIVLHNDLRYNSILYYNCYSPFANDFRKVS